jgi:serine/threonine-protein kinase
MLEGGQLLDGKYRVAYLIGLGGMAAVWAGTNERTGKRVALKMLLPSVATIPGVASLFQREALAASRVNHPNVVTVFDVIEHQGMGCIVMELLSGEPLDRFLLRKGPLEVPDALELLVPAMRGVVAAHEQGVIHRDLKPQNIFVCMGADGRAVTTKVLDFGISLIVERAREPTAGQTANIPVGTPAYMAPEQIAGGTVIDARADVYGFGVLFYEALTGQLPFPGEIGADLFDHILNEPPPPLAQFRPDLTPSLVWIIETALAKQPTQRHETVDAMIAALEQEFIANGPRTRASTPFPGAAPVPSPDAASGRRKTPVDVPAKDPSEEHQATRFLVGFPLGAESGRHTVPAAGLAPEAAPPVQGEPPRGAAPEMAALDDALVRLGAELRPRRWRTVASVGLVGLLAGGAIVLWAAPDGDYPPPADTLPAVAQSRLPASALLPRRPTVAPMGPPAPLVAEPTPGNLPPDIGPRIVASQAEPLPNARVAKASLLSHARMASKDRGKSGPPRPQTARPRLFAGRPDSPLATGTGVSPGASAARAGRLSTDDF